MCNVTKKHIVEQITLKTNFKSSLVKAVTQEVLNTIMSELAHGHRIELRDFGIFEPVYRSAKMAQNPKTLHPVRVEERYTVRFKPGKKMQECVGEGAWAQEQLRLRALNKQEETGDDAAGKRVDAAGDVVVRVEPPIVETVMRDSEYPKMS